VAVLADALLDDLLPLLGAERWGVIQLPPAGLDGATEAAWLEQVAEHVAEFRRNEYAVVILDDGVSADKLDRALEELGAAPLPRVEPTAEGLAQYAIQPPSTSRFVPET
jgi:hypothetical protein